MERCKGKHTKKGETTHGLGLGVLSGDLTIATFLFEDLPGELAVQNDSYQFMLSRTNAVFTVSEMKALGTKA